MSALTTFISQEFRPEVLGGKLDKEHHSLFQLAPRKEEVIHTINAICFGPKKDNVLIMLEHAVEEKDKILVLYYEDMHIKWSYVSTNGDQYFVYRQNAQQQYKLKAQHLYIRGCHLDANEKHWWMLGDFFNFVEIWDGHVLCSPKKQQLNESKLYQLNTSLKSAAKSLNSISLGKSYVVKGINRFKQLDQEQSHVVKSLSGVRSVVVDEGNYASWPKESLQTIPVLFQQKVKGFDLRVHFIDQKSFAKRSLGKEQVDYRYDKHFFQLTDIESLDQELVDFCLAVSVEENNELLGIDFIETDTGYVVLEANPSPGWSAYYPYNGIDEEPFITALLEVLTRE